MNSTATVQTREATSLAESTVELFRHQVRSLLAGVIGAGMSPQRALELTNAEALPFIEDALPGYSSHEEGLADLLSAEGGCVAVAEACKLFRRPTPITRQALTRLIRQGEVIAYRTGGGSYSLPVWQFRPTGGLLKGLPEVLAEIQKSVPGAGPMEPFTILLQEHPLTNGRTPLEALRDGDLAAVLDVVRSHAEG